MEYSIKNKFERVREVIIVLLLSIWMIIPILKEIRMTCAIAIEYEYTFIKIVGAIGLLFLIFDIYKNSKKIENKRKYDKEILPITLLGIFMIWTFISSLFSSNINNAFWGTEYRKDGYITYLAYAGFFSCAFLIKSKESRKMLINMFLEIAILNIIIVELYNSGMFTKIFAERSINSTCFFNSNHYGYYLLLATVASNLLFITEKNKFMKIVYFLLYSFLIYYLILNNTFGCYLAIAVTLILFFGYCIYQKKNRCVALVSIIIFLLMSFVNQEIRAITVRNINNLFRDTHNVIMAGKISDTEIQNKEEIVVAAENGGSGRIKIWKYGIKFFIQSPILGYGPENLGNKYAEVGINQDRPHNLIIQLATTSGIIGLATYISAIGIILIRGLKTIRVENSIHIIVFANIIAYLISAMFGNSMYYTSPYFFIFLGFLMYENINALKSKEE